MNKIYGKEEAQQMYSDYLKIKSLKRTGAKWYCSPNTVLNYIRMIGGTTYPNSRPRKPIQNIMNDWNSGKTSEKLCRDYKFADKKALNTAVSGWRCHGWGFAYIEERKAMTQSEEITAGLIRSVRWCE